MLDNDTVLVKTAAGRDAIAQRTHALNPRQRALLISINGELSVGELQRRFGAGAPAGQMLETLDLFVAHGLVEATAAPAPAPPPASKAPAAAKTAPAPPERAAPAAPEFDVDWRSLQSRAGALLHELMGPDADLLSMRLERARTEREFFDHLERSIALIESTRGRDSVELFRVRLTES